MGKTNAGDLQLETLVSDVITVIDQISAKHGHHDTARHNSDVNTLGSEVVVKDLNVGQNNRPKNLQCLLRLF